MMSCTYSLIRLLGVPCDWRILLASLLVTGIDLEAAAGWKCVGCPNTTYWKFKLVIVCWHRSRCPHRELPIFLMVCIICELKYCTWAEWLDFHVPMGEGQQLLYEYILYLWTLCCLTIQNNTQHWWITTNNTEMFGSLTVLLLWGGSTVQNYVQYLM